MSWIMTYKTSWRLVSLILMVVALSIPWAIFDIIHVPSPWECSEPWVRSGENFCGLPASPLGTIIAIILNSFNIAPGIGSSVYDSAMIGPHLPGLIFTLPLISSLVLILKESVPRQEFHVVVLLVFTAFTSLNIILLLVTRLVFWGLWLYISLLIILLVLEIRTLVEQKAMQR